MSVNRENIVWPSRDGTWNLGFYECYDVDTDKEDWDFEWDVDYNFDRFEWVSTGHPSRDAALAAWHGSNPGGGEALGEPGPETDALDAMAKAFKARK